MVKMKTIIIAFLFILLVTCTISCTANENNKGLTNPNPQISGKIVFESDRDNKRGIYLLEDNAITFLTEGYSPRLSCDSTKVVFVKDDKIYVMDLLNKETSLVKLNYDEFMIHQFSYPILSQDGTKVLFIRKSNKFDKIYEIDLTNNNIKLIVDYERNPGIRNGSILSLDWSLDGRYIVYSASKLDKAGVDIFLFDVHENKNKILITSASDSSFSPDGRHIAYSTSSPQGEKSLDYDDIFVYDLKTGEIKRLTNTFWEDRFPCWSPDGEKICFESYRHRYAVSGSELFIINKDGTNETRITNPSKLKDGSFSTDGHPHWSK